jgi:hypothetical protein
VAAIDELNVRRTPHEQDFPVIFSTEEIHGCPHRCAANALTWEIASFARNTLAAGTFSCAGSRPNLREVSAVRESRRISGRAAPHRKRDFNYVYRAVHLYIHGDRYT